MKSDRRNFIKTGAVLASAFPLFGNTVSGSLPFRGNSKLTEPSRAISVRNESDVIVCGGGPAGIAAAISAARHGAKTTLIEAYGCLGGIWTTGLLSYLIDYENKPGIMKEIVNRLEKSNAQYTAKAYDTELMKWTLDQMCIEEGIEIRLHSRVVAAYKDDQNKLEYIVTESFSGREAWKAKVFIDCTGNGDVAYQAGCGFDFGHPKTGKFQPFSLMAIITGLNENEMISAGYMGPNGTVTGQNKQNLYNTIKKAGMEASYSMPTFFGIRPGLIAMMANHQYGFSPLDADQVTQATMEARHEVNRMVMALRELGGSFSNMRIVATGSQIGFREGRRIHGHYTLSVDDLVKGARFDDAVCRVTFGVDVHALERQAGGGYSNEGIKVSPYDIPLRSLIAKDVEGLMMAGRCISGDFFAHASYRVTGNAVKMGEAAGQVAAQAALQNVLPEKVNFKG